MTIILIIIAVLFLVLIGWCWNSLGSIEKTDKIKYIIIAIIILCVLVILGGIIWYQTSLGSTSKNSQTVEIQIELGSSSNKIAQILKEKDLIKSVQAFKIYTKLNKITDFQAGSYILDKNMKLPEIVEALQTGVVYNSNRISITFLEGKTMRWYASKIEEMTNNTENDVYELLEDENYIDELIQKYWFLTYEIKDEDIYYPLEGYLFPDTYMFESKDVTVKEIFEKLLDQTQSKLEKYKEKIQESKYSVHELITIASMVEMEGVYDEDRKDIASVFYNRLDNKMALGSDVTTYYAIKVEVGERDLYQTELNTYNPYNTRGPGMEGKLPIGPISSVSETAIEAAISPNQTSYMYFVADKNGKVYFTRTNKEHLNKVNELKNTGLWYEF